MFLVSIVGSNSKVPLSLCILDAFRTGGTGEARLALHLKSFHDGLQLLACPGSISTGHIGGLLLHLLLQLCGLLCIIQVQLSQLLVLFPALHAVNVALCVLSEQPLVNE